MQPINTIPEAVNSVSSGDVLNGIQVATENLSIDYRESLDMINQNLQILQQELAIANEFLQYCAGFLLFAVIVVLCYFGYKFLRMFF